LYGKLPSTSWNFNVTYTADQLIEMDISESGYVIVKRGGIVLYQFQGTVSDYKLVISSGTGKRFTDIKLSGKSSQQLCTDLDTDGDTIPNRLDLDSDGDGCSDAKEAGTASGTTSSTGVVAGNYGNNGFADALELTAPESGLYASKYTYNRAVATSLNGCLDSDGDGASDLNDYDDDNDGVLDWKEATNCVYPEINLAALTYNGGATTVTLSGTTFTLAGTGGSWSSKYSNQALQLPIHLEYKTGTSAYAMVGLLPIAATKTPNDWQDGAYKIYNEDGNLKGKLPNVYDVNVSYTANTKVEMDIADTGWVIVKNNVIFRSQNFVDKFFQRTRSLRKLNDKIMH
jgi:hypothetical protein